MKKRSRLLALLLTLILMLPLIPLEASANSPPPVPFYRFQISNLPENAVYVDLLIPLSKSDESYVEADSNKLPEDFSSDAEIINYCDEGFRSYTFHYLDAASDISLDEEGCVYFFADSAFVMDWEGEVRYTHEHEIYELGTIRLAILDRYGNILQVSPVLTLTRRSLFEDLRNEFLYDMQTQEFTVESWKSYFGIALYKFLSILGTLLTCSLELLVAVPFGIQKHRKGMIFWTNAVSQALMYVLYAVLYGVIFWKYRYVVILLEVLVYTGEYLWYSRKMHDVSRRKILLYTVTANTASLILGLFTTYSLIL